MAKSKSWIKTDKRIADAAGPKSAQAEEQRVRVKKGTNAEVKRAKNRAKVGTEPAKAHAISKAKNVIKRARKATKKKK